MLNSITAFWGALPLWVAIGGLAVLGGQAHAGKTKRWQGMKSALEVAHQGIYLRAGQVRATPFTGHPNVMAIRTFDGQVVARKRPNGVRSSYHLKRDGENWLPNYADLESGPHAKHQGFARLEYRGQRAWQRVLRLKIETAHGRLLGVLPSFNWGEYTVLTLAVRDRGQPGAKVNRVAIAPDRSEYYVERVPGEPFVWLPGCVIADSPRDLFALAKRVLIEPTVQDFAAFFKK